MKAITPKHFSNFIPCIPKVKSVQSIPLKQETLQSDTPTQGLSETQSSENRQIFSQFSEWDLDPSDQTMHMN